MKICFVDIDGVCMRHFDSRISTHAREALRAWRDAGGKIILHSTWRECPEMLANAESLFRDAGVPLDGACAAHIPVKREAIIEYLTEHYADAWPEEIVVVDDWEIAPIPGVRIVRIDPSLGLRPKDVESWNTEDD